MKREAIIGEWKITAYRLGSFGEFIGQAVRPPEPPHVRHFRSERFSGKGALQRAFDRIRKMVEDEEIERHLPSVYDPKTETFPESADPNKPLGPRIPIPARRVPR